MNDLMKKAKELAGKIASMEKDDKGNLIMLIKQLVAVIQKKDANNKTASRALKYLKNTRGISATDCLRGAASATDCLRNTSKKEKDGIK